MYYATDLDGQLWEGATFGARIRQSRYRVAEIMTRPDTWSSQAIDDRAMSSFRLLRFWQLERHSTFGGALLERPDATRIQYAVVYLPNGNRDTRNHLTLRFAPTTRTKASNYEKLEQAFLRGFEALTTHARPLGELAPSVWDVSAASWESYVSSCEAYDKSMQKLCTLADLHEGDTVLDVGAGCGKMSRIVLNVVGAHNLYLLDSSPQMLELARRRFQETAEYVLPRVPPVPGHGIVDLRSGFLFDHAIIHMALPSAANSREELQKLASWLCDNLKRGGRVSVAAHNTAVRYPATEYDPTADVFRAELLASLRKEGYESHLRSRQWRPLDPQDVEIVFQDAGFARDLTRHEEFRWTVDNRVAMWKVPAVLDSLVDITKIPSGVHEKVLQTVANQVGNQTTLPLGVTFWRFSKRHSS